MDSSGQQIQSVSVDGGRVNLTLSDGELLQFEDCWLRDNCRCKSCYSNDTFQRVLHVLDVPAVTVTSASASARNTQLRLTWSDGHESTYAIKFLNAFRYDNWTAARCRPPQLWSGHQVSDLVAHVQLPDFLNTEDGARRLFSSLLDYGVAFVEGVKPDLESTRAVCSALGGVQHTLFGDMWEFTSVAQHADTAYTTLPLAPHTDSTYFTESTGLQILHCVEHSGGSGGSTVLADGFQGATLLQQDSPEHFDFLARHISEAEYLERNHHHRHAGTIIRLDPNTGHLEQIRFNAYDRSPVAFRSGEECRAYYAALRALASIYHHPDQQWWFKLKPGTVLVMDNWRVLHGRSAFSGRRVLCGSYVARSDWRDRARVMGLLH